MIAGSHLRAVAIAVLIGHSPLVLGQDADRGDAGFEYDINRPRLCENASTFADTC